MTLLRLGNMYNRGLGVPTNEGLAFAWFQKAAQAVCASECELRVCGAVQQAAGVSSVGVCLCCGTSRCVPIDRSQGHPTACYELASCYRVGRGTPVDLRKSFEFFDKAAQLGVPAAKYELGNCTYNLVRAIPSHHWHAVLPRGLTPQTSGAVTAPMTSTTLCGTGKTRPRRTTFPQWHAHGASERRSLASQIDLARCLLAGDGTPKDPARALALFARGAERGNPVCMHGLAAMHYQGVGVPQSTTEALKWWRKAADAGLVAAQIDLAGALRKVGQAQAALRWYETVAEEGNPVAQHVCGYEPLVCVCVSADWVYPVPCTGWARARRRTKRRR